jgi:hypothetical protein
MIRRAGLTLLLLAACAVCLSLVVPGSVLAATGTAAVPAAALAVLAQAAR